MWHFMDKPYVTVAQRKKQAESRARKLTKKGQALAPIVIQGRSIARTFWGKSWCKNLECYSDYENRLPRGRSYVRNGSVIDLKVTRGNITALVSGSDLYTVKITIAPVAPKVWKKLCADCAGSIDSLVELLQGRFSKAVMERVCLPAKGLFPSPKDIKFNCSCPDWASMCKHVAAVLYGVGARLDTSPEQLFLLRGVDHNELVTKAGEDLPLAKKPASSKRILAGGDLGTVFGLEMAGSGEEATDSSAPAKPAKRKPKTKSNVGAPKVKSKASKPTAKTTVGRKKETKPNSAKTGSKNPAPSKDKRSTSKKASGSQQKASTKPSTPRASTNRRGTG
jgi:uncharacterized Zn finger protein